MKKLDEERENRRAESFNAQQNSMYTQPVNQRFIDQEKNRQLRAGGGGGDASMK